MVLKFIQFRIHLITLISLLYTFSSYSQGAVGIGTNLPEEDAILDVSSGNRGMLIPRIDGTSKVTPKTEGLIIYNTQSSAFEYYDGSGWVQLIPTPTKFNLNMTSDKAYKIINLADGTNSGDAVNKGQLDAVQTQVTTADANNLDRDGTDTMTGNLNMNGNSIINSPAGGALTGNFPSPSLAANSVGASQIQTNAVGTSEIANLAVTLDKLANSSIDESKVSKDRSGGIVTMDYVVVSGIANGWNDSRFFQESGLMGVFQTNGSIGRPPGTNSASEIVTIVYVINTNLKYQIAFVVDQGNMFMRVYSSGAWGAWQ